MRASDWTKCILAIVGSIVAILVLAGLLCGCTTAPPEAHTNVPGTISHERTIERTTPTAANVVVIAGQWSTEMAKAIETALHPTTQPVAREVIHDRTTVVQPENPAGAAILKTDGSGGATATLPASYTPAAPAPPTPTAKALGGLVWLGGALLLAGVLLGALRFTAFGHLIPIGLSVGLAGLGGFLIAYSTVLSTTPWWVTWLTLAVIVAVAVIVATRDNWKKIFLKLSPTSS